MQLTLDLNINSIEKKEQYLGIINVGWKIAELIKKGKKVSKYELSKLMCLEFGGDDSEGKWLWKEAYEAIEVGLVLYIKKWGRELLANNSLETLSRLTNLQQSLPTHAIRSEKSLNYQQFSTPLTLSYIAVIAAQINSKDTLLEPSAGTGMLAAWAASTGSSLILNELDEQRRQCLESIFLKAKITGFNAEHINDYLSKTLKPTLVLMNPPFSQSPRMAKRNSLATLNHVKSALLRLAPGGRLVTISANWFSPNDSNWSKHFTILEKWGKVRFSAGIEGKAYYKHGTTMETRLTVFDKVRCGGESHIIDDLLSPEELFEEIKSSLPSRDEISKLDREKTKATSINIGGKTSKSKSTSRKLNSNKTAKLPLAKKEEIAKLETSETISIDYEVIESKSSKSEENGIYAAYTPQRIRIAGAKPHPSPLVTSTAMAAVKPPAPSYKPHLPKAVLEKGLLSEAQLETIIYAGQAHQQLLSGWYLVDESLDIITRTAEGTKGAVRFRRGFFNGDGTGVGKGRQIAGVILDNWLKGRTKALWISSSSALIEDAQRDWQALGGNPHQIFPLSKYKQGESIDLKSGILFTTYATLRSTARQGKVSRLEQIVAWLGKDHEGVVVFDESHALANATSEKGKRGIKEGSQQGIVGLRLQRALPNARVLYVSATGATKLNNLSYLERLGLWGDKGSPFGNREEFLSEIGRGGVAALEVVSRDLKALGLYNARSLSFAGVQYEIVEHQLTEAQKEQYNEYAKAFQIIHDNLEEALKATNITSENGTRNRGAKSAVYSAFESNKQRFFGNLIKSMKSLTLIKQIESDLAQGHSAVIQLIGTDEALLERRLALIPSSQYNDIQVDITPREYLFDYLISAFPTQLHEVYTDEDGAERSQAVFDEDGNPVESVEAVQYRDKLIEDLALLAPIPSALDMIIHHFGNKVAEVTGRGKRIVKSNDKLVLESRSGSANLAETRAFMDNEKQILIFSQAGGTGRSYHADLNCRNQRLRRHYLLESGFRADVAIQGLGRTNRSNQAQPPVFCVVGSDVQGEKRFTSTISSRLDSLGALTKGERKTGGQGLYRQEDNLESIYAKLALRQTFEAIYKGQINSMSVERFESITGLKISNDDGGLLENLPPMRQFLNRCLAMELSDQRIIFEALELRINRNIEQAIEAGVYEIGVENLKGDGFQIIEKLPIYHHHESGSNSCAVKLEVTKKLEIRSLDEAISLAKSHGGQLLINSHSGRAAVGIPTTRTVSEDDGAILERIKLIRPASSEKIFSTEFSNSEWVSVSASNFSQAWSKEVNSLPTTKTETIFLIVGLLLPIWKQLDTSKMKIYRVKTNDGEKLLGRLVSADAISSVADRLNSQISLSASEIVDALKTNNKPVTVSGNLKLGICTVAGKERLELTGWEGKCELQWLKKLGIFTEYLEYRLRAFVPNNENAVQIINQILTN